MSYCRWSSDDHRSDLYVYPSRDGWTVHVAGRRARVDRSALPVITAGRLADPDAWFEEWYARHSALSALLEDAEYVDIDLPHAGDSADFDTPGEAADAIEWLAALGFYVPSGVIEALRDEVIPA